MLLKGAYCVGEHFVDPHCTPEIKVNSPLFVYNDSHLSLKVQ